MSPAWKHKYIFSCSLRDMSQTTSNFAALKRVSISEAMKLGSVPEDCDLNPEPVNASEPKKRVSWKASPNAEESNESPTSIMLLGVTSLPGAHQGIPAAPFQDLDGEEEEQFPGVANRREPPPVTGEAEQHSDQAQKKRSRSPPTDAVDGEEILYLQIKRIERTIHKYAKYELALLNKAKKLRQDREVMAQRVQAYADELTLLKRQRNPRASAVKVRLPPTFHDVRVKTAP